MLSLFFDFFILMKSQQGNLQIKVRYQILILMKLCVHIDYVKR